MEFQFPISIPLAGWCGWGSECDLCWLWYFSPSQTKPTRFSCSQVTSPQFPSILLESLRFWSEEEFSFQFDIREKKKLSERSNTRNVVIGDEIVFPQLPAHNIHTPAEKWMEVRIQCRNFSLQFFASRFADLHSKPKKEKNFKLSGLVKFIHCYLPFHSHSLHDLHDWLSLPFSSSSLSFVDSQMCRVACVLPKILFQKARYDLQFTSSSPLSLFTLTYSLRLSSKYTHMSEGDKAQSWMVVGSAETCVEFHCFALVSNPLIPCMSNILQANARRMDQNRVWNRF